MRNLVPCTFEAGTRTIHIPLHEMTGVENIRLIVNETQKVVICSSMQKDNITSCVKDNVNGGWDVTYKNDIPALASGDALTVEIDLGNHNYIDGTDVILKAKIAGVAGPQFEIGPEYSKGIQNVVNGGGTFQDAFSGTAVTGANLSGITTLSASVMNALTRLFYGCVELTKLSMDGVTSITGTKIFYLAFSNTGLQEVSFASLRSTSNGVWQDATFPSSLKKVTIHPDALSIFPSGNASITPSISSVENLILTDNASKDIHCQFLALLNAASVKNILEHCCNNNMSGKTITFYTGGLTVQDDADGTIQTLYNSVVNTYGATIANLTITPYSA